MNQIEFGDCRAILRQWASEGVKVQTCVTSPPYFGLRDYQVEGQIGMEQTPEEYITAMIDVFRCVRDVLADDGTLWLNIGDSYANVGKWGGYTSGKHARDLHGVQQSSGRARDASIRLVNAGYKPKDLIGIPWMLAFALRADGWFLRQDIIWHKPNPMPESVQDRCTKAHEYIFLLSKSERYFFDSEAMKEDAAGGNSKSNGKRLAEQAIARTGGIIGGGTARSTLCTSANGKRNRRSVWTVATKPYKGAHFATFPPALIEPCILAGSRPEDIVLDPFMGSGTTAAVAVQHGRRYLGCELNPKYRLLQSERLNNVEDLFSMSEIVR